MHFLAYFFLHNEHIFGIFFAYFFADSHIFCIFAFLHIDELLQSAVSLVSTFQYEARDLRHDLVQATVIMPPGPMKMCWSFLVWTEQFNLLPSTI